MIKESPEVVMRHYGPAFTNEGTKIMTYPSAFAIAAVMLSSEKELDARLKAWQAFRKEHYARDKHKGKDSPLFKLDGKSRKLLDLPFGDLKELLLDRITKEEGARTLYTSDSSEAVQGSGFSTHYLFGYARRKENARGDVTTRHVTIGNPLLDRWDHIAASKVSCGECNSKIYEDTKEANVNPVCYHAAEVWEAFWMSVRGRKDLVKFKKGVPKNPAIPFNLTPDDLWGLFLDIDTLVARYIQKDKLASIDRKLVRLAGLSSPLEEMVKNGEATFQVVRQYFSQQPMPALYVRQTKGLIRKMRDALQDQGFSRLGYVLEHENSNFETVAERYVNGNKVVSICFRNDLPLHYVVKELSDKVDLNGEGKVVNYEDPFKRVNKVEHNVDDATRRKCESRILLPGSSRAKKRLYIPLTVANAYRKRLSVSEKFFPATQGNWCP